MQSYDFLSQAVTDRVRELREGTGHSRRVRRRHAAVPWWASER